MSDCVFNIFFYKRCQRHEVGAIGRIICGNLKNIEKLFSKDLIVLYNYDGSKNKNFFKKYGNILKALYEGYTYEEFINDLRGIFRRIKNTYNKEKARQYNKENSNANSSQ
ncbi:hypothetical protein FF38_10040 [Lucilia cuprina]|uniref:Uncharacterized protein n=1 Tax=Lucilia cuprina TaxID=7375 RepID=A0A0L0C4C9_LUCCU|nr:hypothetical protein FF38_10040 [Lucilia cuprina]